MNAISISRYQGDIDWAAVRKSGIQLASAKSGEGATHTDPSFVENFTGAKQAGIKAGATHYFMGKSITPEAQGAKIIQDLKNGKFSNGDCFVFGVYPHLAPHTGVDAATLADNLASLMDILKKSGLPFSDMNTYIKCNLETLKDSSVEWTRHKNTFIAYHLWVERWVRDPAEGVNPKDLGIWKDKGYRIHEYTKDGQVNGIRGNVSGSIISQTI